ncbi:MAG: ATP-binding protein [Rhizobacter sp.]
MMALGIRMRLAMLLALLLTLMAVAAGYALYQLRGVSLSVQSVYDDRVLPLFHLRSVADTYVMGLPRVARELRDGVLTPDEATKQLARARVDAREQWLRYKATLQVARETTLIAEAEPLIAQAEVLLDGYATAVAGGGSRPSPAELQAATRPLGKLLDELVLLQAQEVQAAAAASEGAYGAAVWALVALVGLACALGVGLAWAVAVRYARERRERELQAEHLSHCYAALSRANQMIVRVRDEALMHEELCRICVDARLAHIAVIFLNDGDRRFHIAGSAGPAQALLAGLPLQFGPPDRAEGPIARALRDGRTDISNDYLNDARVAAYHARAHEHRVHAMGTFPIRRGGVIVGCLALCVDQVGFFDAQRVLLVEEMAGDLSFALDNLDRDAAHAAAEQAQRDAESASRAKTEFLSRMSHELRTPLNAVLGFSQLLQSNAHEPLSDRQREQVEAIRLAGWHLLALVNDVLDVSRIESGQLRVESYGVNLVGLLDEVMRLLQPEADRARVRLYRHDGPGPAVVMGDPLRLRQVLVNLITNAIKYNRPEGRVNVVIARVGSTIALSVADNGIGMTRAQLDGLFEPFNRLGRENSVVEGTGIGLVLTRQLLTLMHGTLGINSEEGLGTTVVVTLQKADTAQAQAAAPPRGPAPASGLHDDGEASPQGVVLYIEDNPINLLLVEQLLLRWPGIRLVQAETGSKGLELARALQPDLVLLDMRLPDLSGPQVLQALRSDDHTRGLRVVALSASAMPEEVALARESGALDYWTKPIDFDLFTADINRLLSPRFRSA